jgi:hypothetical protein
MTKRYTPRRTRTLVGWFAILASTVACHDGQVPAVQVADAAPTGRLSPVVAGRDASSAPSSPVCWEGRRVRESSRGLLLRPLAEIPTPRSPSNAAVLDTAEVVIDLLGERPRVVGRFGSSPFVDARGVTVVGALLVAADGAGSEVRGYDTTVLDSVVPLEGTLTIDPLFVLRDGSFGSALGVAVATGHLRALERSAVQRMDLAIGAPGNVAMGCAFGNGVFLFDDATLVGAATVDSAWAHLLPADAGTCFGVSVAVGDVTGDRVDDLVVAGDDLWVVPGPIPEGRHRVDAMAGARNLGPAKGDRVRLADVDGDGARDIVASSTVTWATRIFAGPMGAAPPTSPTLRWEGCELVAFAHLSPGRDDGTLEPVCASPTALGFDLTFGRSADTGFVIHVNDVPWDAARTRLSAGRWSPGSLVDVILAAGDDSRGWSFERVVGCDDD